jgi:hypothetical protein
MNRRSRRSLKRKLLGLPTGVEYCPTIRIWKDNTVVIDAYVGPHVKGTVSQEELQRGYKHELLTMQAWEVMPRGL